ncbi:hypothetical protein [Ornithinicoccus hortensis]|uniref:Uncharacterized protein n=1 Tax=Ornithinicoccus hortensis TaxID=82346 RepID=A0A542YTL4_9MICO|nr:hypothetical protein [Ornithinicoccus hortensis]TQL51391.1 hypothetical protein FB467_2537 [Ornithinicoccus hortensis]
MSTPSRPGRLSRWLHGSSAGWRHPGAVRARVLGALAVLGAVALGVLTVLLVDADVGDSLAAGEMAAIYYGFLLGAAAIVFAIAFTHARYWPAIGQIARYCWLRTWVFLGAVAMVLSWLGAMLDSDELGRAGAAVWVAAALLGTFSLVRVVKLSNATTLNGVMSEQLLATVRAGRSLEPFHLAAREALAQSDPVRVRDLTGQLSHVRRVAPELAAGRELQASYATTVVRAALVGDFDGGTAGHAVREALFGYAPTWDSAQDRADLLTRVIVESAPTVARFEHRARMLAGAGVASVAHAMDVRSGALAVHQNLRLLFDPQPKRTEHDEGSVTLDLDLETALTCYRALTIRPVPDASSVCYALYQHVRGERFGGNYYAGAPILEELKASPEVSDQAALALELIVAEQIVTCTSREGQHPPGADWYAADDERTVRGVLRIAASLGAFTDARAARRSWLAHSARIHEPVPGFAHPPRRPSGPALVIGLAVSHLARLAVVDKGAPARCQDFLDLLPSDLAPLVRHRVVGLLGATQDEPLWPRFVAAAGPEEG